MIWNGKKKAITFSFDDGVTQDIRTIEILDKYGLKATFNLNSGKFGTNAPYEPNGKVVDRRLIEPTQVKELKVLQYDEGNFRRVFEDNKGGTYKCMGEEVREIAFYKTGVKF